MAVLEMAGIANPSQAEEGYIRMRTLSEVFGRLLCKTGGAASYNLEERWDGEGLESLSLTLIMGA